MTPDVCDLDATAQAELVHGGGIEPIAPVTAALRRIDQLNPQLNCVISDRRHHLAKEIEDTAHGTEFRAVPILIKDLGSGVAGEHLWNGNRLLKARKVTASADSPVVACLRAAGFAILGRTNTAEFGSTIATEPLATGPTRNPWNHTFSAGGSSGGSAAAVAAGFAPVAHGTDASGSIRIPAAACGVIGLKPSAGTIEPGSEDHGGWFGIATSGVFARTVRDVAGVLRVMQGRRPNSANDGELQEVSAERLTVVVLEDDHAGHPENWAALQSAERLLRSLGHEVTRAAPPFLANWRAFHRMFVRAVGIGLVSELESWERRLGEPFTANDLEPSTRALAKLGRAQSNAERAEIFSWLERFRRDTATWWSDGPDLFVTPVLATAPPPLGWFTDPAEGGSRVREAMRFTPQFNVSGDPAISLPLHRTADGLPVGIQVVAANGQDHQLLAVVADLERLTGWNRTAWPTDDGSAPSADARGRVAEPERKETP